MTVADRRERFQQTEVASKAMIEEEARRRREKSERLRKLREAQQPVVFNEAKE